MIDLMKLGSSTKMNGEKADALGMITPYHIVTDMTNLIFKHIDVQAKTKQIWELKFLDITCKSGNFTRAIYNWLINHEDMIKQFPKYSDRHNHIVKNQIYGACLRETDMLIANRNTFGTIELNSHIKYISGWQDKIKNNSLTEIQETLKETLGQMKFDIVIGNPPYNNDIYLDFVTKAHGLIGGGQPSSESSNGCVCMITPAKWQAKCGQKNEDFRRDIVPYMKDIVFYPVARDIFDIVEADGITYYLVDKNNAKDKKRIRVICSNQPKLECDFYEETFLALVNKTCRKVIEKCYDFKKFYLALDFNPSKYLSSKYQECIGTTGDIEVFGGMGGIKFTSLGYVSKHMINNINGLEQYKVYVSSMVGDSTVVRKNGQMIGLISPKVLKPYQICKSNFCCLKTFDNEMEANSLVSYLNTKLIRFLISCSCVGAGLTAEFFRFVPDPGEFDHIFTDQELYEKYNLTLEEIEIIESIIKERK